jgi:hypothetical protein
MLGPDTTATTADDVGLYAVAAMVVWLIVALCVYLWYAWGLSRTFPKLGVPAVKGWIPIVNEVEILKLGGFAAWNVIFFFLPVISIYAAILHIIASHRINGRFGKGAGTTVLAVIAPPIWATVLAFAKVLTPVPLAERIAPTMTTPSESEPTPTPGPAAPIEASDGVAPEGAAPPPPPVPAPGAPPAPKFPSAPYAVRPTDSAAIPIPAIDADDDELSALPPARFPNPAAAGAPAMPPPSAPAAPPAPESAAPPPPPAPAAPASADDSSPVVVHNPWAPKADAAPAAPSAPAAPVEITAPPISLPEGAELNFAAVSALAASVHAPGDDEDDEDGATVVVDRKPRIKWFLSVDGAGDLPLTAEHVLLGRKPTTTTLGTQALSVPDTTRTLSKLHARLDLADGRWTITDLNSTNGVLIVEPDGTENLIEPGSAVMVKGRFILGRVGMSIRFEGADA